MKLAQISRLFRAPGSEGLSNHWSFIFMYFRIFAVRAATHYHTGSWQKLIQEKECLSSHYIMFVASSSETIPSLFKLCSWGPTMALLGRSHVLLENS